MQVNTYKDKSETKMRFMSEGLEQVLRLAKYGIINGGITEISIHEEISKINIHLIVVMPRLEGMEKTEGPEIESMSEEQFSSFLSFLSLRERLKFIPVNKNEALKIINTLIARPEWILDYKAQITSGNERYEVALDLIVPNF